MKVHWNSIDMVVMTAMVWFSSFIAMGMSCQVGLGHQEVGQLMCRKCVYGMGGDHDHVWRVDFSFHYLIWQVYLDACLNMGLNDC